MHKHIIGSPNISSKTIKEPWTDIDTGQFDLIKNTLTLHLKSCRVKVHNGVSLTCGGGSFPPSSRGVRLTSSLLEPEGGLSNFVSPPQKVRVYPIKILNRNKWIEHYRERLQTNLEAVPEEGKGTV